MSQPGAPSERVPSLDGIRAISISMVMVAHVCATLPSWAHGDSRYWSFVGNGTRGVSIFFVVSGFIITLLLLRERVAYNSIDLRAFYVRRFFRIVPPLYVFLCTLLVCWKLGSIEFGWRPLLIDALFVRDYIPSNDWWSGHIWSLSVEEQFYILWPTALFLLGPRKMQRCAMFIIVAAPLVRLLTLLCLHTPQPLAQMFHMHVDGLLVGCVLALWRMDEGFQSTSRQWLRGDVAAACGIYLMFVSTVLSWHFGDIYWISVGASLEYLCVGYLVIYLVERPDSPFGAVLNTPVAVHIGQISYSLYLWQQLFLTPINHSFLGVFPLNMLAALVVAELSWRFVERPFVRIGQKVQQRTSPMRSRTQPDANELQKESASRATA